MKFTDPLLATWYPTTTEQTKTALVGLAARPTDTALTTLVILVAALAQAMLEKSDDDADAFSLSTDIRQLARGLETERRQLQLDLVEAIRAAGPTGTPWSCEFQRRHFGGPDDAAP